MSKYKSYYDITDEYLDELERRMRKAFMQGKSHMAFDEMNVLKSTKRLYGQIEEMNREAFLKIAKKVYGETAGKQTNRINYRWLAVLLAAYNPITQFVYDNELIRKRDRYAEAYLSSKAKTTETLKAFRYMWNQTKEYADQITHEAVVSAYTDMGVEKVVWKATIDGRECETCRNRNGKVYPIGKVPGKPHRGCRCTIVPYRPKTAKK